VSNDSFSFPTAAAKSDANKDPTMSNPTTMPPQKEMTGTADAGSRGGDLLGRAVDTAHDTIDRLADRAAPHVGKLEEGMHGAGDLLHERADHLQQIGAEWMDDVRTSVREHPLAAVGIALAAGMLIARLSR
jgi:ElaB/YqjD/DUF883 family membrane-anchored ribosome-binding protein